MLANTFCLELINCINLAFQTEALIAVFTGGSLASAAIIAAIVCALYYPYWVYNMAPDMFMFRAMSIRQQNNKINASNWAAQALVSVLAFPMG